MKVIQISDAVAAALEARRTTADAFLRQAFDIKEPGLDLEGGVHLPNGTKFAGWFKDKPVGGVVQDGAMVIEGHRFTSPSGAAKHVAGRPVNGWEFWEVKVPGAMVWVPLDSLRTSIKSRNGKPE